MTSYTCITQHSIKHTVTSILNLSMLTNLLTTPVLYHKINNNQAKNVVFLQKTQVYQPQRTQRNSHKKHKKFATDGHRFTLFFRQDWLDFEQLMLDIPDGGR